MKVFFFNQINFSLPIPLFNLLFTGDSTLRVFVALLFQGLLTASKVGATVRSGFASWQERRCNNFAALPVMRLTLFIFGRVIVIKQIWIA